MCLGRQWELEAEFNPKQRDYKSNRAKSSSEGI